MKSFFIKIVCLIAVLSTSANAAHWGVQVSKGDVDLDVSGMSLSYGNTVLTGIYGEQLNKNVALDLRWGFGVSSESFAGTEISVGSAVSMLAKFGSEISRNVYPYLAIGYTRANLEFNAPGFKEDASDGDISYGVGMNVNIESDSKINLEFMNYFDKDGVSYDALSIGFLKEF